MSAIDSQLPSSSGQDRPTDEVDRILSPGKLIILGLQHLSGAEESGYVNVVIHTIPNKKTVL